MLNCYYSDSIDGFLRKTPSEILGSLSSASQFDVNQNQNAAWSTQIAILKNALKGLNGSLLFEFSIPRLGGRIDVILIIQNIVFVIEFKVGADKFLREDYEQVWDYALDLKNFHQPSHQALIVPILVATEGKDILTVLSETKHNDKLLIPLKINKDKIRGVIESVLSSYSSTYELSCQNFLVGRYYPTPTIVEAALAFYNNHNVEEITRNDADAYNLVQTADEVNKIIEYSKKENKKSICFVTGVPGAGKTLVGLKIATTQVNETSAARSVYLSGNGPLVQVLREALTRDKISKDKRAGIKSTKKYVRQSVHLFIQNIHHYRDTYLVDKSAPYDHVAIFDEAQRAWNAVQTTNFMRRRKGILDFDSSEPEFLISCLNRHRDSWATIVCLVGGGQEINTGEAGIAEWLHAIRIKFPDWDVYLSENLKDNEYNAKEEISLIKNKNLVKNLHLNVSLRSFRAEKLSEFVYELLQLNKEAAIKCLKAIIDRYPIKLTRNLSKAKEWLKLMARGSERYGMVVSSQAERLKPLAISVKHKIDPIYWFLEGKEDVRSSFFLEDVATEFHIQGLEIDWACLTWDGDLRYSPKGWSTHSFKGTKWQKINSVERKQYLINAYRVLLTRARQGMIIVVPEGNSEDQTRKPEFYDSTYKYLIELGIEEI